MNTEQYDDIVARLDRIETLLNTKKPGRKAAVIDSRTDLTRVRVASLETLFWRIVNAPRAKKAAAYRVPETLLGTDGQPNVEAVVLSVLLNQASLRKIFRTAGVGDSHTETPLDRARRALAVSNLIVLPISKLRLGAYTETPLAVSPGEVSRKGRDVEIGGPVGWTTTSRAVAVRDRAGELVEPPVDPCGARVWPGELVDEEELEEEPVERLTAKPVEARKTPNIVINLSE